MKAIAITGSIASGKSTATTLLRTWGYPVFDADAQVHAAYCDGTVAAALPPPFREVVSGPNVDRSKLSNLLHRQPKLFADLEAVVHPIIQQRQSQFRQRNAAAHHAIIFFDIPLLFEGNRENQFDATIYISAPDALRRERALARPSMTAQKFDLINARQLPDHVKRKRATHVIENSASLSALEQSLSHILSIIQEQTR